MPDYDVNRDATRQEMRTYVCGQCHVEYYFKGPEKRLTYPWAKGLKVDSILAYYDANGHTDWTHASTGAPVLKAQHPEFEMYNQGIHARSGVACADCHMPYKREGAMKISDHHVRSPLLNINRACQTCHKWREEELRARVETHPGRAPSRCATWRWTRWWTLIGDIEAAQRRRADRRRRWPTARRHQRRAQFLRRLHRGGELDGLPRAAGGGAACSPRRSTKRAGGRPHCRRCRAPLPRRRPLERPRRRPRERRRAAARPAAVHARSRCSPHRLAAPPQRFVPAACQMRCEATGCSVGFTELPDAPRKRSGVPAGLPTCAPPDRAFESVPGAFWRGPALA